MHKKNCVSFKSATHGTKSSITYTKSIEAKCGLLTVPKNILEKDYKNNLIKYVYY